MIEEIGQIIGKQGHGVWARRLVGSAGRHESSSQIGRYQRVLGGKMVVQRALADADLGRDGIDPDRPNALQIEQPVGGFEDPLLHARFCKRGSHATDEAL